MALNCSNSGQSQPFCGDHWRSRGLPDQSERHELFRLTIGRSLFEDLLICMWLSPLFPIWINLFLLNKTPQACIRSLLMVVSWTCVTPASSIAGHLDFVVLCAMSTVSSPGGLEVKPFFSCLFQVASKTIWGNIAFISTMPDNALNSDRQVVFKSAQSVSGVILRIDRHLLMFCLMWRDCDHVLQVQTVFLWEMPFMSSWAREKELPDDSCAAKQH